MNILDMLCDEDFINLAYLLILDREPDSGGYQYFLTELKNGLIQRRGIIDKLFFSEECRRRIVHPSKDTRIQPDDLCDEEFIDLAYQLILKRKADPAGLQHFLREIESRRIARSGVIDEMILSSEYADKNIPPFIISLHSSRCMWVKNLPKAELILDLGGSSAGDKRGSLVAMGYPYFFKELKIVDLPLEKRHRIYAEGYDQTDSFESDKGKISYIYTSMHELQGHLSSSIDLINMGESIEHIFEHEADHVLSECMRILKPGGFLCIDTPNGVATHLQSGTYIDPDHKIEYSHDKLSRKIKNAGFIIVEQKGMNYMPLSFKNKAFDITEASRNSGIFDDIEHCYLLGYRCQRPMDY